MRHFILLVLSFFILQAYTAPLEARQDDLDPLGSFLSSVFLPEATTTAKTDPKTKNNPKTKDDPAATATATPPAPTSDGPSDPNAVSPTTDSSSDVSAPTSSPSSIIPTTTTTSISSLTTSSTTSSATPAPTNALNGEQTPTPATQKSGPSISTAGIVVAIIMSLAVLAVVAFIVWKFYGPVVRWREKREYERMQERSYRPALDGPFPSNSSNEKGLGISGAGSRNRASVMSFLALARPRHQIKRKPVPISPLSPSSGTLGSGGTTGVSPLIAMGPSHRPRQPSVASSTNKNLPSLPQG